MNKLGLIVLLAACSKSSPSSPPTSATGSASGAPAAAPVAQPSRPACTPEIEAQLAKRLGAPAGNTEGTFECIGGLFGAPGFFVSARYYEGDGATDKRGILAADLTKELVPVEVAQLPPTALERTGDTHRAADLDGDGVDELVQEFSHSNGGVDGTELAVFRVRHGKLVGIDGPAISYDDTAADPEGGGSSCTGALSLESAAKQMLLVVTVSDSTGSSSNCLAKGRHVFALEGDRLVERK